jgi:hypothetical protein
MHLPLIDFIIEFCWITWFDLIVRWVNMISHDNKIVPWLEYILVFKWKNNCFSKCLCVSIEVGLLWYFHLKTNIYSSQGTILLSCDIIFTQRSIRSNQVIQQNSIMKSINGRCIYPQYISDSCIIFTRYRWWNILVFKWKYHRSPTSMDTHKHFEKQLFMNIYILVWIII